jgi:hypothetical protein
MSSSSKAFDMSKMAIGGIGQMLDSVEFVKRAWSTFNIPSTLAACSFQMRSSVAASVTESARRGRFRRDMAGSDLKIHLGR